MATETLSFDILARDQASASFRNMGRAASDASGNLRTLSGDLDRVSGKTAKARVKLDGDKEAEQQLDRLDLRLLKLNQRKIDPEVDLAGYLRTRAEITKVELQLDRLNAKRTKIHIAVDKVAGLGFLQPSAIGAGLALLPTLIPLAAQATAAVGALGISFGAAGIAAAGFGLMASTVLAGASKDLAKLQALNLKLATATTAAQKKAVETQIKGLKATWSKGYLDLIGIFQDFQAKWKKTSQDIVVPALTSWLQALTRGLSFLAPALKPVAALFQGLGETLNAYFANHAAHVRDIAAAFGRFAATQLADVVRFITGITTGFVNLGKALAANGANFGAAGSWLAGIGDGFATWSKSASARADVQGFMKFLHDNGGTIKSILQDLGKILPGIFAGATTVGTLELKALAAFLNLVAKLPKGWQAGLTEAAGALLLLSKLGVIKVGLKLVGVAAKLLSGGTIALGGGAAAAEMRAAMVSGGAAAAAEIRAALTGGGATAAGEGGGAAAGGGFIAGLKAKIASGIKALGGWIAGAIASLGTLGAAGAVLGGAAIAAGLVLRLREDLRGGIKAIISDLPHWLEGASGIIQTAASGWADAIVNRFSKPAKRIFSETWHSIASSFDAFRHDMSSSFDAFRHQIASSFDSDRHLIATVWDTIWRNTVTRARNGISDVIGWFRTLPGRAISALWGLGSHLYAFAHAALNDFLRGLKSVAGSVFSWVGNFVRNIWSKVKGFFGIHSPSSLFYDIGKNLMLGLFHGIKDHAHHAQNALGGAINFNPSLGVAQWAPLVRRALSMEGLPQSLTGLVLYQMQTESGGNPNIVNTTDINAQLGHPSIGLMQVIEPTFERWHWPGTSWNIRNPLANIAAALNYAAHGRGFGRGPGQLGSGHGYAFGTSSAAKGWAWVGERGPELVKFRGGEQVYPAQAGVGRRGGSGGGTVVIQVGSGRGQLDQALRNWIVENVRVQGGGDVQAAFGTA